MTKNKKSVALTLPEKLTAIEPLDQPTAIFLEKLEEAVGGRQRLIEALVASDHPAAKKLVSALGRGENADKTLLEVVKLVQSSPSELAKAITSGNQTIAIVEAMFKLASKIPSVVDASIEAATTLGADGFADRKLLMEASGLVGKHISSLNIVNSLNTIGLGGFEKVMEGLSQSAPRNPFEIEIEAEEVEE